jgi:hypothetical protein
LLSSLGYTIFVDRYARKTHNNFVYVGANHLSCVVDAEQDFTATGIRKRAQVAAEKRRNGHGKLELGSVVLPVREHLLDALGGDTVIRSAHALSFIHLTTLRISGGVTARRQMHKPFTPSAECAY